MATDFSTPQRQSPIGVLIMFFDTFRHYAGALGPLLIVMVVKFNQFGRIWLLLGAAVIFVAVAAIAFFKFLNYTFFLDAENGEFIVSEGIFNKTVTIVQLDKIQQVSIRQSLLQRLIGVHSLDIDTAGSRDNEIGINAISHDIASELKFQLLKNERSAESKNFAKFDDSSEIPNDPRAFINISFLSLLKVGITSNYIRSLGILLAFFATIYDNLRHLSDNNMLDDGRITGFITGSFLMRSIGFLLLLLFFGILMLNVIRTIFKYFNFRIARQSGSLLLSFGLLNIKNTIVKPEKVQIVSVTRNYFQKKLDIIEVQVKQAAGGEKEAQRQAIDIPGCNETERDAMLKLIFGQIPEKGVMMKPNFRKLGFAIFLTIILPLLALYMISGEIHRDISKFTYAVPIYVVFMALIQYFNFRNSRLFINGRFIIKQSGAWDIENEIIEPHRIQALTTSQLFWHKGIDIGSLTLHTAGGNISFQLGNFTKIKEYVNLWLYELETSDSNWM